MGRVARVPLRRKRPRNDRISYFCCQSQQHVGLEIYHHSYKAAAGYTLVGGGIIALLLFRVLVKNSLAASLDWIGLDEFHILVH